MSNFPKNLIFLRNDGSSWKADQANSVLPAYLDLNFGVFYNAAYLHGRNFNYFVEK